MPVTWTSQRLGPLVDKFFIFVESAPRWKPPPAYSASLASPTPTLPLVESEL